MNSIVNSALAFLGTPYLYGGNSSSGIDCSGLTQQAYLQNGITIPRTAQAQYDESKKIEADELLPGDLIFMGSSPSDVSHVMMYIGNNQAVESPSTGKNVRITSINRSNIVGYGTFTGTGSTGYTAENTAFGFNLPGVSNDTSDTGLGTKIVKFIFVILLAVLCFIFLLKAFN